MQTISQRTKKAREVLGMTKSAFAAKMMYDRNYVSAVESGKQKPGPRFIRQLEILEREIESGLISKSDFQGRPEWEVLPNTPQLKFQRALAKSGMTVEEFARRIGYS